MAKTIELTATAAYGRSGQYVARLLGRDPTMNFKREFIGRKSGKRGETTTVIVDQPALYAEGNVDKHGRKEPSFWLVWAAPDGELYRISLDEGEAMTVARRLDEGEDVSTIGRAMTHEVMRQKNLGDVALDQDELRHVGHPVNGTYTALTVAELDGPGTYPRREIVVARKRAMVRLMGGSDEEVAAETTARAPMVNAETPAPQTLAAQVALTKAREEYDEAVRVVQWLQARGHDALAVNETMRAQALTVAAASIAALFPLPAQGDAS